jgi:VIT1/CCC1 family predicted Fe2+/Mn2+ transporter
MKKITFKRPKESFNQGISYKIFIGNNMLAELKNGEEKTIEISTEFENKSIKAKMQKWCGSEKVKLNSLSENETLNIKGNKFLNKRAIFIGALLPLTGVLMFSYGRENLVIKNIGIGLFFLILFFAIGILTVARNKWLNIEK